MQFRTWLSPPETGQREQELVSEALASGWVSTAGPFLNRLEQAVCAYTGSPHAVALSSGTAALHLALRVLDIGPGDAVFCPSLTFAATVNPVCYVGAMPFLVDSDEETWGMSAALLEAAVLQAKKFSMKPRAVIPVHLYGMPADLEGIMQVCEKYGLDMIEDAAESLGSTFKGRHTGTFGRLGVYSFNGNKIITTGGGGALVSADEKLIQKAKYLSTQAREPVPHYEHKSIGYNYRLGNIPAAIGCAQFESLEEKVRNRRVLYAQYLRKLGTGGAFSLQPEADDSESNRWLSVLRLDKASELKPDALIAALALEGIEARHVWKPMHRQAVFANLPFLSNGLADTLFATGVCLPSGKGADAEEVVSVIKALNAVPA